MRKLSKVAIIAGYGVGISVAFANKLGAEGFKVALLARTKSRLDAAVAEYCKAGASAKGYITDLSDAAAVKASIAAVQQDLGPINLLFWNPYATPCALLSATADQWMSAYNVTVTGLAAAVQAAHDDLKAQQGAVLVTGGGGALERDDMVAAVVNWGMATLAVGKAAQRRLVHIMHAELAKDNIYVAEVTVMGVVKGTAFDSNTAATLTPEAVADELWDLYCKRDPDVWFVTKS